MWINPNHPNPPQQRPAAAPQESGVRVATFQRHGGEELRVSLAEFNGHPFVSFRVWSPGQDGQLWPVRGKGVTIKLREVAGLAYALADIANGVVVMPGTDGADEGGAGDRDDYPRAHDRRDEGGFREGPPDPHSRPYRPGSTQAPFDPGSVRGMGDRPEFDEFT